MLTYLWSLIGWDGRDAAGRLSFSACCGALWAVWGESLARLMLDPLVLVVTVLWALDWVTGGALAWRERRYNTRRGLYSVVKWLLWMAALGVGWAFRCNGFSGDDIVPVMIGAAIVWTEGLSVLRNCAALAGAQGGLLSRTADGLEGECSLYYWKPHIYPPASRAFLRGLGPCDMPCYRGYSCYKPYNFKFYTRSWEDKCPQVISSY